MTDAPRGGTLPSAAASTALAERVLSIKEYNQAYRDHLKQLTATAFSPKKMHNAIAILEGTVKQAREPFGKGLGFGPGGMKSDLRQFVTKRAESVVATQECSSRHHFF